MNRKDLFIKACNEDNGELFFADFSDQESKIGYVIRPHCQWCKKSGVNDIYYSYWKATWTPTHKECKPLLSKETAYECQKIDANCNDCKFFIAKKTYRGGGTSWRTGECEKGDANLKLFPDKYPALAQPNFCQGNDCFIHRSST